MPTNTSPSYSQFYRRTNKFDIDINDSIEGDFVIMAVDNTGIKVTNRGQWVQDKWNIGKKGYLKIHVSVNIKTKEFLVSKVTDEKVYDGKVMEQLVKHVLENKDVKVKSVLVDDAYDSNKNFKFLQKKRIQPGITVRKNSIILLKNNSLSDILS